MKNFILTILFILYAVTASATVSITDTRVQYTCNGTTTTFTYAFQILEDADLVVTKTLASTLGETALVLNTDYTVTGAGGAGGTVELTAGSTCASGYELTITRAIGLVQEIDLVDGEAFSAETLETGYDKLTLITQDQGEDLGRTLKLKKTSTLSGLELPNPTANNAICWDSAATGMANCGVSTVAVPTIDYIGNYASLAAAVAAIGSDATTLMINAATVIPTGTTVTIPSTLTLWFTDGGSIDGVSGGAVETLNDNGRYVADGVNRVWGSNLSLTLADVAKDSATPYNWGLVVGDNTAAAANVTAINACLDAAIVCRLPAGTIYVTDSILIDLPYQHLIGEGRSNTILFATAVTSDPIIILERAVGLGFVRLADFAIDGDDKADYGIRYGVTASVQANTSRIYVRETNVAALWLSKCVGSTFYDVWLDVNNGHGIAHYWADSTNADSNLNRFFSGRATSNTGNGVYISGKSNGWLFEGFWFEDNQEEAVLIDMASLASGTIKSFAFNQCWFEGNNASDTSGGAHIRSFLNAGTKYPRQITISNSTFGGIGSSTDSYLADLTGKDILFSNNSWDWDVNQTVRIQETGSFGVFINDRIATNDSLNTYGGTGIEYMMHIGKNRLGWADNPLWTSTWSVVGVGGNGTIFNEILGGASKTVGITNNSYNQAGTYKYSNTDQASLYRQKDGEHFFETAPSDVAATTVVWTTGAKVDQDATGSNTRLLIYDNDNSNLDRVSVGAADSGGAGYKVLRIPN